MARTVVLNSSLPNTLLPNGLRYQGGETVILSDPEYSELSAAWKTAHLASDTAVNGGGAVSLPVPVASGGTGAATQQAALDALAGATTSGRVLRGNGTHVSMSAIQTGDLPASLDVYLAPSGATSETFPRENASSATIAPASGTLCLRAIALPKGLAVANLSFSTGAVGKAGTGGTYHGWYVLLDSSLVVRAVTADQADASTVWGSINTIYTLATNAYTTTYSGLFYAGVMVSQSGGTMPQFTGLGAPSGALTGVTPVLAGTSSTGQTTPPSAGATMGALSGSGAFHLYAYTS